MEDIKKRLAFKNPSIQNQALLKLYSDVLAKKNSLKTAVIKESSPEIAELQLLWECPGSEDILVANTSCKLLVALVTDGHAEFSYVINGFLNRVPSAKSLNEFVRAISDLLVLQIALANNQGQKYKCPYTLRSPPHPFITVLTNRPDAWVYLQQQVKDLCLSDIQSVRHHALQLLSPFIKFVLLEPQQSSQYQPMRDSLQRAFLHIFVTTDDPVVSITTVKFISAILPYFQVYDKSLLATTCIFAIEFLNAACKAKDEYCDVADLTRLARQALYLCEESLNQTLSIKGLTDAVLKVASIHLQTLVCNESIVCVSSMMLRCPPEDCLNLIKIALFILEQEGKNCVDMLSTALLVLPCLQLLGDTKSADKYKRVVGQKVSEVMSVIERRLGEASDSKMAICSNDNHRDQHFPESKTARSYANLCRKFTRDRTLAGKWLKNLNSLLLHKTEIHDGMPHFITSLLVTSKNPTEVKLILDSVVSIARADHSKAVMFLPALLYYMGRADDSEIKMATLKAIPHLAQQKYCVPPVLKTVQLLGTNPALKATSIHLLTELWVLQDRTYPHLLRIIVEDIPQSKEDNYHNQVLLAKAKAVKEVCKIRGSQHGADMLGPLSTILEKTTGPYGGAAATLALEGLFYLCEAEVIDIQSAWAVLGEQLSKDTRAVVKAMICRLFSLLPELKVKTPEFEKFQDFVLHILWLSAQKETDIVSSAALDSLSSYSAEDFKISHMNEHLIQDFLQQASNVVQTDEDQEINIDDVIPYVPGVCFTRLLKELSPKSMKSYEKFLSAMVTEELENLPRGVFYSSLRQHGGSSNQNKAVVSIPDFILQQYEKTRQPGLRPGLAAGLLFSYDLPVEVGRDGKPRKHSIITRSKNYQQMFSTLLHEVLIQPSDWHRCMVSPHAWTTFVERLFAAMLEGRKAEIELQVKRDHISASDAEEKFIVAWMWVRDQLTDVIKGASRGSPTMQGNAILSLAGLAWVLHKHVCSLDKEARQAADASTEYKSHSHWLTVVVETMMSLMDITYSTKGQLLGMCQQRSADDRLPASILAQASTVMSFSQLVPFLITRDTDSIFKIISSLQERLPGEPLASDSPVVQFHVGLGLGRFLASLIEDHFLDICGNKGLVEFWECLDLYEQCCFSDKDNVSGAILGLGLVISALCQEGKTEARAHSASVLEKLTTTHEAATDANQSYQALSVCLAMTAGAAFGANMMSVEQVNATVHSILTSQQKYPQMVGISLSIGMLTYNLWRHGHPGISDVRKQTFQSWMKQWNSQEIAPIQQLAILSGLMALVGTERTLVPIQGEISPSSLDINIDDVVKVAKSVVAGGNDPGVQRSGAWILGHLYLSASTASQSRSSIPTNYAYLPEQSFIRALVDFLIEAGKLGPESVANDHLRTVLAALQSCSKRPLPPLNWTGVLSPLMRISFNDDVQELTLTLAIQQSTSSSSAAMFLTAWMLPPLYNSLSEKCAHQLFDSLPVLIKSASSDAVKTFLQQGQSSFGQVKDTFHHFLYGLHKALKVSDPPEAVTAVLCETTKEVYSLHILECDTLHLVAECLGGVPDELFDELTQNDLDFEDTFLKGLVIRCYLVGQGRQPIAILNGFIDACLVNKECDLDKVEVLLQHTLWQMSQYKTDFTTPMEKLKWLTELLGHLSNVFRQQQNSKPTDENGRGDNLTKESCSFALATLSSAVILWTFLSSPPFLGIDPVLLSEEYASKPFSGEAVITEPVLFETSPPYLSVFSFEILKEPWCQVLPKVYDWMNVLLSGNNALDQTSRQHVKDAVLALRHATDFRKPAVWTEFIAHIDVV